MRVKEYISKVTKPFCSSYDAESIVKNEDFQTNLTEFIRINYGRFRIRPAIEFSEFDEYWDEYEDAKTDEEIKQEINAICENVYTTNAYKYDRLYATTVLEYNPIENYNMVEEGHDERDYSESGSHGFGAQSNSGSKTIQNGAQTNSTSGTDITGAQTVTEDNDEVKKVQPFNSGALVNAEKTENDGTTTNGARTDSHSSTDSIGAQTNSETESTTLGAHTDTDSKSGDDDTTHYLTRSGNVGVTTSQQMIESERKVALFNMYSVVAHDIMKKIALVLY